MNIGSGRRDAESRFTPIVVVMDVLVTKMWLGIPWYVGPNVKRGRYIWLPSVVKGGTGLLVLCE